MSIENRHATWWLPTLLIVLAIALLVMTIVWQIPMMLWDHLDLLPMYSGWLAGDLAGTGFWDIHGGHLHTSAYAVLLFTTWLADGQPWLDGVVSWLLLAAYAAIIIRFLGGIRSASVTTSTALVVAIALLCLYPGHLANLQWGWQVAVFLCMTSAVASIHLLTRTHVSWVAHTLAILSGLIAMTSFATGIAIAPVALLLIVLRNGESPARRIGWSLPWLALIAVFLWKGLAVAEQSGVGPSNPVTVVHYALNVIGGGVARFATDIAPWLAALAIAALVPMLLQLRGNRQALPWLGLVTFAMIAALAIAWGRAMPFGTDHAFATRYVSFSSMFWLGWLGLFRLVCLQSPRLHIAAVHSVIGIILAFAVVNAANLIGKAASLSERTGDIAAAIRDQFPDVDPALLNSIYFDQPDIALERVKALHRLGFPPFERVEADIGTVGER